jgi:hypothetical protein
MADKPDPENRDDDRYSEEETARRRDATIRAMIGMGPEAAPTASPERQTASHPERALGENQAISLTPCMPTA